MKAKYILYTLGIALLSSSCSDFLDEDPKGKLTPGTFFSTGGINNGNLCIV